MKLAFRDIEPFVKAPNPAARAVVVYGPDNGLMRERAKKIAQSIVADINDPFNAVSMTGDQLLSDPARLPDEAFAMSMMGGRRLIRITDATDSIAPLIKDYLAKPSPDNLVVIEAGELGPKSALRLLAEKAQNAAAIPCYVEDERDLSSIVRDTVRHAGYQIDPDAVAWLATELVGDRARARGELEKLITYMGAAPGYEGLNGAAVQQRLGTITPEDVQACCGAAGERSVDDLVYCVAGGKADRALKAYNTLVAEGVVAVTILRALQNHFRKLHLARSMMASGLSMKEAMDKLTPKIFFKQEEPFRAQLNNWPMAALENVMARLSSLEAQTKQTGVPVETLCAQALLSISRR